MAWPFIPAGRVSRVECGEGHRNSCRTGPNRRVTSTDRTRESPRPRGSQGSGPPAAEQPTGHRRHPPARHRLSRASLGLTPAREDETPARRRDLGTPKVRLGSRRRAAASVSSTRTRARPTPRCEGTGPGQAPTRLSSRRVRGRRMRLPQGLSCGQRVSVCQGLRPEPGTR